MLNGLRAGVYIIMGPGRESLPLAAFEILKQYKH